MAVKKVSKAPPKDQPKPDLEKLKTELNLKRSGRGKPQPEERKAPAPVSAGPVDKVIDMVFNPADNKILEFTSLDRNQVKLIPQLGIINDVWEHCIKIAEFREDALSYAVKYKETQPAQANLMDRFIFLTAQCQRSLNGLNMKSAIDLALAEKQAEQEKLEDSLGHGFGED